MRELELLAPARNIEIGIAAIDCGADAVYLAGPSFGARQAAGNSVEDIRELCSYAHRFGARVFVTLNTILFDGELEDARSLALAVQEAGADALIVQDFALPAFELERPEELTIPLHASTQCSIRTAEDARRMDALGFSRIVLERELPLTTVREICSSVSCEVEAFVHGALCVCYSGQCYLSQMLCGRSANRGECAQACRSRYDLVTADGRPVLRPGASFRDFPGDFPGGFPDDFPGGFPDGFPDGFSGDFPDGFPEEASDGFSRRRAASRPKPLAENRTLLSLKDLNLIDRLPEMAEAGVSSFKIEGRLKGISYVRNVVAAYSRALDVLVAANPGRYRRASFGRSVPAFAPSPEKSFNRGFTQLFFDGKRGRWACLDAGKALGEEVGTVSAVSPARDGVRITVRPSERNAGGLRFNNGDGFVFIGRDGVERGFRADVCDGNVLFCGRGGVFGSLSVGTRLYRNLDVAFEKAVAGGAVRRIGVSLSVKITVAGDADVSGEDAVEEESFSTISERSSNLFETAGRGKAVIENQTAAASENRRFRISIDAASEDGREYRFVTETVTEQARNLERILEMIRGQLGKGGGVYGFSVAGVSFPENSPLPMLSAAQLNGMRRTIAEELDRLPCGTAPLRRSAVRDALPEELRFPKIIDYKRDVANSLAAGLYRRLGAETVEPAYEIRGREPSAAAPKGGVELMRSRYCILYELGFCRKTPAYSRLAAANNLKDGLFLRNNGRLLRLGFDCASCEMTVLDAK